MTHTALAERTEYYRMDAAHKLDPARRSALGQFMTPSPIARFMASLFEKGDGSDISILDPGAGVGSLSAALIEEIARAAKKPRTISLTAYEIEPVMLGYLRSTMDESEILCAASGIELQAPVKNVDFIADAAGMLTHDLLSAPVSCPSFTHVIANPPYKKIHSASEHRALLRSVGIETSNLYTAFLALAIRLMRPGGQIVAIVPRSFCNGRYFRPFREFMLGEIAIRRIHIFESRSQAFAGDEVLQENIIFHGVKGAAPSEVVITASSGAAFMESEDSSGIVVEDMSFRRVPHTQVVKPNDPEKFIHIAACDLEQRILDRISVFSHTLPDLGIEVSTGPVVDFRLKDDIAMMPGKDTVALLYPVHFQNNVLEWPKQGKKPNAIRISEESRKWLWANEGHFVITRRFTAKEEKRRIVASVYDASLPGKLVGFENHLNVFHAGQRGLESDVATGLAVYLNSTLVDRYFRQFNGHTQVNATDLRTLGHPDINMLKRIGVRAGITIPAQDEIDRIIEDEIQDMAENKQADPLRVQQKKDEALTIVKAMGMPSRQHNERSALTLLALLNLKPDSAWSACERPLIGITPIMEFCRDHYGKEYAPNTREAFRRQTMHQFVDAAIAVCNPDQPERAVNSPKACYQVSARIFEVLVAYGTKEFPAKLEAHLKKNKTLAQRYAMERKTDQGQAAGSLMG